MSSALTTATAKKPCCITYTCSFYAQVTLRSRYRGHSVPQCIPWHQQQTAAAPNTQGELFYMGEGAGTCDISMMAGWALSGSCPSPTETHCAACKMQVHYQTAATPPSTQCGSTWHPRLLQAGEGACCSNSGGTSRQQHQPAGQSRQRPHRGKFHLSVDEHNDPAFTTINPWLLINLSFLPPCSSCGRSSSSRTARRRTLTSPALWSASPRCSA